jgi:hypothetical protein
MGHGLRRVVGALVLLAAVLIGAADASAQVQNCPTGKRTGTKYKVRIDSAPQQAAIYLDDERCGIIGYTPWDGRLAKGEYKIIIKVNGYESAERYLTVKRSSRVQDVFVPMVKQDVPAVVQVTAAADPQSHGAEVWVDGQLQGSIPIEANMRDGRHLVEIKKAGFGDFAQWVDVKQGERVSIHPVLKGIKQAPALGAILVDADVQDAEVYIDGARWKDTTPTLLDAVDEGLHVIEVRKSPALPWKQTVTVEGGKTVKVIAGLSATAGGATGSVRVISNIDGARVYVDGTDTGKAPLDVRDLKAGEHIIEVRAPGYKTRDERLVVSAGSAHVLKLDLHADGAGGPNGLVKVVSPVPEATVYIDGALIGKVPQTKDLPAGEHFVVVKREGLRSHSEKIKVTAGQTLTVTALLKAAGGLRVVSTPAGASVMIDGEPAGRTPLKLGDVEAGEHVVSVALDGHHAFQSTVNIAGGKTEVLNAPLRAIDDGPTPQDRQREQRGMSSFGARTLPRGRATVDIGAGYPHFAETRITVGAGDVGTFGFDAGILVRTFLSRTDLAINARLRLYDNEPFSLGVFGLGGYGGPVFDDSMRSSAFADTGAALSLTALSSVTITGRGYFSWWTDRFCPKLNDAGDAFEDGTAIELCSDYLSGDIDVDDKMRVDELLGDDGDGDLEDAEIFTRDNGVRVMLSLAVEIAVKQHWNMWLLFEGAPFQKERAAFTDVFHAPMSTQDNRTYLRVGATYKF